MNRKILSDGLFLSAGSFLIKIKGIVLVPILISTIGLGDYGAYTQLMINIGLIAPLCQLGLGQIFYRFTSKYENHENHEYSRDYWFVMIIVMVFSLVGVCFVYLSSGLFSNVILDGYSIIVIELSSLFIISSNFYSINNTFLQARKKIKFYVSFNIVYEITPYLFFVLSMVIYKELFIALLYFLCSQVILNLVLFTYILKKYKIKLVKPMWENSRIYFKYSLPLTISSISGGLLRKADTYFIGFFIGKEAIGVYNLIYTIVSFIDQISSPFIKYFQIYFPKEWDDGSQEQVITKLKTGLLYYLVISIGFLMGLTCFIQPLIYYVLDKDISYLAELQSLIIIIGLGVIAYGVSRIYYQLFNYRKKTHHQLYIQLFGLVINLTSNFYFIPLYGLLGAAWTTFISYFSIIIMCSIFSSLRLDRYFYYKFVFIVLSGGLVTISFFNSSSKDVFNFILDMLFASILYCLFMMAFKIIDISKLKRI